MNSQEMKEVLHTTESEGVVNNNLASDKPNETKSPILKNKQEVTQRLEYLLKHAGETNKQELDSLQQIYLKFTLQDANKEKDEFLKNGGKLEEFQPTIDPEEDKLRDLIKKIKNKRQEILEEDAKLRQNNLNKKNELIDRLKKLVEEGDNGGNLYEQFKKIEEEWNSIKLIPQSEAKKIWSTYQLYVEKFYDLLKLNNEFRAYDFKKNLEKKTALCQLTEELDKEENVISAFHQLQNFHDQWREIGPVSKDLREELWQRFKNASTVINKKHQDHFDQLKAEEEQNLVKKTAICEKIENIDFEVLTDYNSWNAETRRVLALQDEWKSIGYTPKKTNAEIFERYRTACDRFFNNKALFFKEQKADIEANIEEKEQLCNLAEENKGRTDWREATAFYIELQNKWKKTKPVYRKQSEELWSRFRTSCDYFFEQRGKQQEDKNKVERNNLELKKEVISKLEQLVNSDKDANTVDNLVKELTKEWNSIGHVPFKQKDAVYKEYKNLINSHFDKLNKGITKNKINSFKANVSAILEEGSSKDLHREKERLERVVSRMKNELSTYENNLGFLTLSSKKGNSLLDELNHKMDKLKKDIKLMEDKINIINQNL